MLDAKKIARELPGRLLGTTDEHEVYQVKPAIYVAVLSGFYTLDNAKEIERLVESADGFVANNGRIFVIGDGWRGHDPAVRDPRNVKPKTRIAAVVTDRPSVRLLITMISPMTRLWGLPKIEVYRDVHAAIASTERYLDALAERPVSA